MKYIRQFFAFLSRSLALIIINWLEPYMQLRQAVANTAESLLSTAQSLERTQDAMDIHMQWAKEQHFIIRANQIMLHQGLGIRDLAEDEMMAGMVYSGKYSKEGLYKMLAGSNITQVENQVLTLKGKVKALMHLTGTHSITHRWKEVARGQIADDVLLKWLEPAGLWKVLGSMQEDAKALQEQLEKRIKAVQEEGVDALKKVAQEKSHKVDALTHILGLELKEHGNPANVEAWHSNTRNKDADAMIALEHLIGVQPQWDEDGSFVGYIWTEGNGEQSGLPVETASISAILTQCVQELLQLKEDTLG